MPRRRPKRSPGQRLATALGAILILVGLGFLGYVGWQYYGTDVVSKHKQSEVKKELAVKWAKNMDADAIGLLRVPRFGKDYEVPIIPGFDTGTLAKGIGAYKKGAKPGQIGNFVLAGHRVTHGQPFRDFLKLRKGDKVEVETRTHLYTYVLRDGGTDRRLDFRQGWVLLPNPLARNSTPTEPMLTMLTCSELFHTNDRSVVFGDLVSTVAKPGKTTAAASAGATS